MEDKVNLIDPSNIEMPFLSQFFMYEGMAIIEEVGTRYAMNE